ncbi:MAG: alanine--glyoxylate aminotransferase family protein [Rhodospirillales bacterium]|nr:alanine--glyoxylate aminotransferase family protein [Rhodospirillales bacterium]
MSVSDKAWKVIERDSGMPRFYFDLRKAREAYAKGESTFTPAVSLVQGLDVALDMIHEEGLGNVLERHRRLARGLKVGAAALGLENFARTPQQSNTVAAFHAPSGVDGAQIVRLMYAKHRTVIAGARNRMAGKMIRIGTMGAIDEGDILTDLLHLENVLIELGLSVVRGAGMAAAAAAF